MEKTGAAFSQKPLLARMFSACWLPAALIGLPAFLSAFKYARDGLNADIILNQIMALHNPTLFYWGQNRLFNILPLTLQAVPSPLPNLYLVLLAATGSFFGLLWALARTGRLFAGKSAAPSETALVYLLNICLCICLFKYAAWVEICLWHFEYSLALLFGMANVFTAYGKKRALLPLLGYAAGFISLGINPALILLMGCFLFFKCLYLRKIHTRDMLLGGAWAFFFIAWTYLGCQYGSYENYSSILPGMFQLGMENLVVNIFRQYLRFGVLCLILMLLLAAAIGLLLRAPLLQGLKRVPDLNSALYASAATAFSALAMGAIIACIRWYHLNEFAPRYFIIQIFMGIFISSIWLNAALSAIRPAAWLTRGLAAILACAALAVFYPPGFNIAKASIYRECDSLIPAGEHIYVGDYWKIWACVSRDINAGHDSISLGYRSVSDKKNISAKLGANRSQGDFEAICLNADIETCRSQLRDFSSDCNITRAERLNTGAWRLRLENMLEQPKSAP